MQSKPNQIPEKVKEAVKSIDKDAKVILFGSRASGDYGLDSDWDFLILLNEPVNTETEDLIRNKLYEIELENEQVITSIIETKPEWEKYKATLIYKNIKKHGKLVA